MFGHWLLKVKILWATVTYSPLESASTTAVVEVATVICLKSLISDSTSSMHI